MVAEEGSPTTSAAAVSGPAESSKSRDLERMELDDDLPVGHPLLHPDHEVCYLSRLAEMDAKEEKLCFALLASVHGGR